MKFIVPLVLTFAGVGAGVGAGVALRPDPAAHDADGGAESHAEAPGDHAEHGGDAKGTAKAGSSHGDAYSDHGATAEYVSLKNQFIVPILADSRVRSLVVLSIDLEVAPGQTETIHRIEPKIRDALLTVLFDHANAGGFTGAFTASGAMNILRTALREAGRKVAGEETLRDVLITNIVRQDV